MRVKQILKPSHKIDNLGRRVGSTENAGRKMTDQVARHNMQQEMKLLHILVFYNFIFFYRRVSRWNNLPSGVINAISLKQ